MANETDQQPEVEAPQLSLHDIASTVKIIDVVSKRGAFEGGEMADVGAVRNRLVAFLEATQPAEEEEETPEEETPEEALQG
tara:strand:- start:177 stop:419 length:243 start_codon:yes stop_codon:yes gene_type:complete